MQSALNKLCYNVGIIMPSSSFSNIHDAIYMMAFEWTDLLTDRLFP